MTQVLRRISLAVLALAGIALVAGPASARRLDVEIWTDRGDDAVYQPGDAMQLKVRASEDAYLLVYEIDSDGNVNVLFPWAHSNGFVEAHHTYALPPEDSRQELVVEQQTGQGFLVAIASREPLRDLPWFLRPYDPQAASVGYADEPEKIEGFDQNGRVVGDPYVAMERIRRRVLAHPGDEDGFATAYASYYVHDQVRYPRYICYDCHRSDTWAWWDGFDPYYTQCSVIDFRVNWAWAWGPGLWQGYVPYYYYVVRSNCPPRYRGWYDGHTRWSSWDGWSRWNTLWGGRLRRYKTDPPVGYVAPPPSGERWKQNAPPPPGIMPATEKSRGWNQRPLGYGRIGDGVEQGVKPIWHEDRGAGRPGVRDPGADRMPVTRSRGDEGNSGGRWWQTPNGRPVTRPETGDRGVGRGFYEPPRREPRVEQPPRGESPRGGPGYSPPPRREAPPRNNPPRGESSRGDSHGRGDNGRGDNGRGDNPQRDKGGH